MAPVVTRTLQSCPPDVAACIMNVQHVQRTQYGMEPRDDSHLTVLFATGCADPEYDSVQAVAHELYMTNLIYKTTLYDVLVEDTMRSVARTVVRKHRVPWGDAWNIVRRYVPSMMKLYAMRLAMVQVLPGADTPGWPGSS